MSLPIRKLFLALIFNFSLFTLLVIGIQNSKKTSRVNLIFEETVILPISFIVGNSFIAGSVIGSFLNIKLKNKN